ncbi:MAG: flagellar filament capping protein FliD [Defluviitaleaceae bacterium]|nr:flagellar filament capping protein FliD [Defluviitaleaceae bacterium]
MPVIQGSSFMRFHGIAVSGAGSMPGTDTNSLLNSAQMIQRRPAPLSANETFAYTSSLKQFGNKLKEAANSLLPSAAASVTKLLSGASSNSGAASVNVTNQRDAERFANSGNNKNLSIERLATGQTNSGDRLAASGINGAAAGRNTFVVEQNGKSHSFTVDIRATDSNRTAQQKTADAINSRGIGVRAAVEYDSATQRSALIITSKETGERNAFDIRDTGGTLAAALGADKKTSEAEDARYSVDGKSYSSEKNTVDLGDGLSATLRKASSEEIKISTKKDTAAFTNAMYDLINNFNQMRETAEKYSKDRGAQSLLQRLDTIASSYGGTLRGIGVTKNKDGYLEIDTKKLQASVENGSAERAMGGDSYGFAQRVSQLASSVDQNPDRFVSYQSRNNNNRVTDDNQYMTFINNYRNQRLMLASALFGASME